MPKMWKEITLVHVYFFHCGVLIGVSRRLVPWYEQRSNLVPGFFIPVKFYTCEPMTARLTPGYPSSGLSIPLQGLGLKFCAFDFTNQAPQIQYLNWICYLHKGATVT